MNTSFFTTAGVLIILLLFIFSVSAGNLLWQSLRLDEAQSLWQSSPSPTRILNIVAQDVHVPLYHFMLHFWRVYVGDSVVQARALSLIFFMASIPLMYITARLVYDRSASFFAAMLLAVSPFMNWYGNEIRMYSLLVFITLINQYFFISIFQQRGRARSWHWVGYFLSALAGIFTHYFFILALITQTIFYIIYRKEFLRGTTVKFITVAVFLVLAFAPWVWYVSQLGWAATMQPFIAKPTISDYSNTVSLFAFGFQGDRINSIILSAWPIAILVAFLALRSGKRFPPEMVFFMAMFIVPSAALFVGSYVFRPLYLARYLVFTLPSLYLVFVWFISTYPSRLAYFFKTATVVVMAVMLGVQVASSATSVKEDYRSAAEFLTENTRVDDVVALSAPFTIYPFDYYYRGVAPLITLPEWNRFAIGPIPAYSEDTVSAQVSELKKEYQRIWLLLSYDQGYEEELRLYFDKNFERLQTKEFSPGMKLYAYRLRYDSEDMSAIVRRLQGSYVRNTPGPVEEPRIVVSKPPPTPSPPVVSKPTTPSTTTPVVPKPNTTTTPPVATTTPKPPLPQPEEEATTTDSVIDGGVPIIPLRSTQRNVQTSASSSASVSASISGTVHTSEQQSLFTTISSFVSNSAASVFTSSTHFSATSTSP